MNAQPPRIGVVVARLQTTRLHPGHRHILDYARERSDRLIVVIGVSEAWTDPRNPLDRKTRAQMVASAYPDATVLYARDRSSDADWSRQLERIVRDAAPEGEVTLYGSRDSCLSHYGGCFAKRDVPELPGHSATSLREAVNAPRDSEDFRAGAIYAATHQNYPASFQTVDLIVRHSLEPKVLIGRKPDSDTWLFPGGFVDPTDASLETAAKREGKEELGDIEIDGLRYLGSVRVDDHRYRRCRHKILTAVFTGVHIFGRPEARDDLAEIRWQPIDGLLEAVSEQHEPLACLFLDSLQARS